jgi:hypothetical protein
MGKICQQTLTKINSVVPMLVSLKCRLQHKEECCIMMKSLHQEDITILNMCAPENKASSHMKQKLIELEKWINSQFY